MTSDEPRNAPAENLTGPLVTAGGAGLQKAAPQITGRLLQIEHDPPGFGATNYATSVEIEPESPTLNPDFWSNADDYPGSIERLEGSRLTTDIDGVSIGAPDAIGRQRIGATDVAAPLGASADAATSLGAAPRLVPARELGGRGTVDQHDPEYNTSGCCKNGAIHALETLFSTSTDRVISHEFAHMIDGILLRPRSGARGLKMDPTDTG
jgi:hypothetical protein